MTAVARGLTGVVSVGIGEAAWAVNEGRLSTVGLGSCVAVTVYDPVARAGGLLHFQLGDSTTDPERAAHQPFLYGDRGIAMLTSRLAAYGVLAPRSRVTVAGGAQMVTNVASAQIGKRNVLTARKALWKAGFLIADEVVGGHSSRSVSLDVATGNVVIREHGGVQ
jgi:chemotaxis protein CheD